MKLLKTENNLLMFQKDSKAIAINGRFVFSKIEEIVNYISKCTNVSEVELDCLSIDNTSSLGEYDDIEDFRMKNVEMFI
jgi:hypothetical protein